MTKLESYKRDKGRNEREILQQLILADRDVCLAVLTAPRWVEREVRREGL